MKQHLKAILITTLLVGSYYVYATSCYRTITTTCVGSCPPASGMTCPIDTQQFAATSYLFSWKNLADDDFPTGQVTWKQREDTDNDPGRCNCVYQWWDGSVFRSGVCHIFNEIDSIADGLPCP